MQIKFVRAVRVNTTDISCSHAMHSYAHFAVAASLTITLLRLV